VNASKVLTVLVASGVALVQICSGQVVSRPGDSGPALKAEISDPQAVAIDSAGTLYIAENKNIIRRVDLRSGIITTLQTKRALEEITSLAVDRKGNLLATQYDSDRVIKIDPTDGSVTLIAGGGPPGFSGDGGPAKDAGLSRPEGIFTDPAENLYFGDFDNHRIRRVDGKTGIITTIAGSGKQDSSGDGGLAVDAGVQFPSGVAVDRGGNVYISQDGDGPKSGRVRRVDANSGVITTVAGSAKATLSTDGPALGVGLDFPSSLQLDPKGNLYVLEGTNDRVRYIDAHTQIIMTVAGPTDGFGGDGGPAVMAKLDYPRSIAIDSDGNLYVADTDNHRIRRVDARTGIIKTVAGNGLPKHIHSVIY
jgi:DNA-binding beta-propeller fold protein YncE